MGEYIYPILMTVFGIIFTFILLIIVSESRTARKQSRRRYSRKEMLRFRDETTYFSNSEFYQRWKSELSGDEIIEKWFEENP